MIEKDEELILEEKPIVNGNMVNVLNQVAEFNNTYIKFLENEIENAKKLMKENQQ